MSNNSSSITFIAAVVSLGGFLFGFDAAVISGVNSFIVPEFNLTDIQLGWAVASLTLASTFAMLVAGPLSDRYGRRKILTYVGLFYAISAMGSALATSYSMLVIARMLGGLAVGGALIMAPMYIAEIVPAEKRGRMVSINQLNIVLGFSAAYFANYFILQASHSDAAWVQQLMIDQHTWRWMLGLELLPALLFFFLVMRVPESPRWLLMNGFEAEASAVVAQINGRATGAATLQSIQQSIQDDQHREKAHWSELFKPAMKLVLAIGLVVGILQQITGVNAIYFYATNIFELSGIGQDASYAQAIWVGIINVVFTLIAMALIDKMGRKPLLLIGVAGIAISMFVVAFGFGQATYNLSIDAIGTLPQDLDKLKINSLIGYTYENDLTFKEELRKVLGPDDSEKYEKTVLMAAIRMNPIWVLLGILGFVASFAISLGPVMWVLFSELFPNRIRALAISFVGFVNSLVSFVVQFIFPWELTHLGNATTFFIFGCFAVVGFALITWLLPETKGKTLEAIEAELIKT
ncbi:MAG: sugar porter family MFS transporter [Bacteroidota bacterium]